MYLMAEKSVFSFFTPMDSSWVPFFLFLSAQILKEIVTEEGFN